METILKKILKTLFIVQVVSNKGRNPKIGKGYVNAYRLNPYNPLSYVTLIVFIILGIIMFGVVGFWKETDLRNPFVWD